MVQDWTKTKAYRELKKEMLDDLEARGLISRPYIDKVEEYMELWVQLKMLNADIRERGVSIEYQNGENQKNQMNTILNIMSSNNDKLLKELDRIPYIYINSERMNSFSETLS